MADKFQGGSGTEVRTFFHRIIDEMPQEPQRCLDMGSGIGFALEREIYHKRGKDIVDCIDQSDYDVSFLPEYVNSYTQQSIEEEFVLPEKYDCVFAFEVVEHIDKTDVLIRNCYKNIRKGGMLFLSMPNLASVYSRIELFLGLQPHILESSNEYPNCGGGILENEIILPIIVSITFEGLLIELCGNCCKSIILQLLKRWEMTLS